MNIEISVHQGKQQHASATVEVRYERTGARVNGDRETFAFRVQHEVIGLDDRFWFTENALIVADALRHVADQIVATIEADQNYHPKGTTA